MVKEQDYIFTPSVRSSVSSPLSSHDEKSSISSSPSMIWSSPIGSVSASSSHHGSNHGRENVLSPGNHNGSNHGRDIVLSPRSQNGSSHGREKVVSPRSPHGSVHGRDIFSPNRTSNPNRSAVGGAAGGDREVDVRRVPSWTQYFEAPGEPQAVTPEKKHMVDLSQLFMGQKFASGTYSRLYRGQYKQKEVAVKVVKQPDEDDVIAERLDRQFVQEVSLLSRLHHKNIVEFVAAMRRPPVFCIIMEYLPGGSLRAFLHKNQPNGLPLSQVLDFAIDIAQGMDYLHSQGVLHLDLKSHNLVLAENMRVKVTDFGVARLQSECESMTPDSGTYRWMAPEMIRNKSFSTKADVYGFGIILWELFTGQTPYEDMSTIQAAFAVVHKHTRPPIPDTCPRPLRQLMEECWAENPEKRPHFWQIVQRLDELQDCVRRNVSLRSCQFDSEKRNAIRQLMHKCRAVCAQF
ncbi:hypothetical protein Mapa_011367 [Marchantia paleacea]|nr:hypothetical protein Mapa_011367 [Marchantia paleacea]